MKKINLAVLLCHMKHIHVYALLLMLIFYTSCGGQNQTGQAKNNTQPIESKIEAIRLKYTTGVRSILEDSKGNIWFGS